MAARNNVLNGQLLMHGVILSQMTIRWPSKGL
jgi:hypothetical protein